MAHDSTYPSARAQIVLQHFWEVLRQIIRNPYRPFQSLSLTSEEEKVALLSFRSSRGDVFPQLVHALIEERALKIWH